MLDWLRRHLGRIDARAPTADELMVTAGNSEWAGSRRVGLRPRRRRRAGRAAHLPLRAGILVIMAGDRRGPDRRGRADPRRAGGDRRPADGSRQARRAALHDPDVRQPDRPDDAGRARRSVAEQARRHGFVIAEDDVYRELWSATELPPSIWAVGGQAPVFRLGSFSKTLAPALRLGWLTGPASPGRTARRRRAARLGGGSTRSSGSRSRSSRRPAPTNRTSRRLVRPTASDGTR